MTTLGVVDVVCTTYVVLHAHAGVTEAFASGSCFTGWGELHCYFTFKRKMSDVKRTFIKIIKCDIAYYKVYEGERGMVLPISCRAVYMRI